ncbi:MULTISPECIES: thiol reductant ABC exporter subunit CydC [Bacillaceae]|uniref:Thiol reductant ABC exporter subunit CydC n=1 Tax=Evansella alkalicola TaxID=745819 RepID=A0ABS6JWJ2_9BACI|nr:MULTISPECIES: thiol reductant ABC exporter subunit CydC [Bacillaceae]MBU9722963.1 thiol reductant ABC exporter subunit CydC [Bacillus alkalicola]
MKFYRLLRLMTKEKKYICLAILFGFLAAISSIGLLGAGGYLISQAALEPPLYTLTLTIIAVRFFGLLRAGSRYGERYMSHKATFRILGRLRAYVYDLLEPVTPQIFSKYRSGDLLARMVSDVDRLQFFFLKVVYPPVVMVIVFLLTGIFLIRFSLLLTVVLWLGFFFVAIAVPMILSMVQKRMKPVLREKNGALSNEVSELFYGFTDLKTNLQLSKKNEATEYESAELINAQEREHIVQLKGETIAKGISFMVALGVLFLGVMLVNAGEVNGVMLALLVLVSLTVFETATPMVELPGHIEESHEAERRVFSVSDQDLKPIVEKGEIGVASSRFPQSITFQNVSFAYPGNERSSLKGISFRVNPGEKVAIVGPSGSGKTTVLQLLLQFYYGYSGEINIGNHDIKLMNEESTRELFSVVMQENYFFQDTVKKNLLLAKPNGTEAELKRVLEAVSLQKLPLETMVNGMEISGGERQRLAIARMLLKDAPIVLLDELTTGIDSITEQEIFSVLWPHVRGKSVIYITHRLRDLHLMDKIIVIDKGRILEQGTYKELMKKQHGYFRRLKQLEQELV